MRSLLLGLVLGLAGGCMQPGASAVGSRSEASNASVAAPVATKREESPRRHYHGRLRTWEEPGEFGAPTIGPGALLVFAEVRDGYRSDFSGLFETPKGIELANTRIDGTGVSAAALDTGAAVILFRPTKQTNVGQRFSLDPTLSGLNMLDGDRNIPLAQLEASPWIDPICPATGAIGGWRGEQNGRLEFRWILGEEDAPFEEALLDDVRPPHVYSCAFGGPQTCSSVVWTGNVSTLTLTRICAGTRTDEVFAQSEFPWTSGARVHREGALVAFRNDRSLRGAGVLDVRTVDGQARQYDVDGRIYAVTFWDEHIVIVHTAQGDPHKHGSSLTAIPHDLLRGPLGSFALDRYGGRFDSGENAPRGLSVREAFRTPMLLPRNGNGRPLLLRLGDALVLVSAKGHVWSWPADGGAFPLR